MTYDKLAFFEPAMERVVHYQQFCEAIDGFAMLPAANTSAEGTSLQDWAHRVLLSTPAAQSPEQIAERCPGLFGRPEALVVALPIEMALSHVALAAALRSVLPVVHRIGGSAAAGILHECSTELEEVAALGSDAASEAAATVCWQALRRAITRCGERGAWSRLCTFVEPLVAASRAFLQRDGFVLATGASPRARCRLELRFPIELAASIPPLLRWSCRALVVVRRLGHVSWHAAVAAFEQPELGGGAEPVRRGGA